MPEPPRGLRITKLRISPSLKFRRYWTLLSPGIIAIRRLMLTAVKREAERRELAAAA